MCLRSILKKKKTSSFQIWSICLWRCTDMRYLVLVYRIISAMLPSFWWLSQSEALFLKSWDYLPTKLFWQSNSHISPILSYVIDEKKHTSQCEIVKNERSYRIYKPNFHHLQIHESSEISFDKQNHHSICRMLCNKIKLYWSIFQNDCWGMKIVSLSDVFWLRKSK